MDWQRIERMMEAKVGRLREEVSDLKQDIVSQQVTIERMEAEINRMNDPLENV